MFWKLLEVFEKIALVKLFWYKIAILDSLPATLLTEGLYHECFLVRRSKKDGTAFQHAETTIFDMNVDVKFLKWVILEPN